MKLEELSKEELRRYQLKLNDMLSYLDNVCKENHLRYFITWGSCLGAVRHHGFIPWDDDLDIAMPRPDYDRLYTILKQSDQGRYVICRPEPHKPMGFHIMQLRDSTTTFIYNHSLQLDTCHGIKIDICPMDGCPDNAILRKIQTIDCLLYGLFAAQREPNHAPITITHSAGNATRLIARLMLSVIRSPKLRDIIWQKAEKRLSRYEYDKYENFRCLQSKPYPKDMFGDAYYIEFEGNMRPIPAKYDEYLTRLYGNYMELPPENKRKPQSEVALFDLDHSYLEYKGKAWCFNEK